jgi:thiamine-phosphate pyrophosphorylase
MLREKRLDPRTLLELGRRIMNMAPNLTLWVNDRLDVALALGVGFHGSEGYPEVPRSLCPISRPIHDAAQIQTRAGSDQLLVSPVFGVPGKGRPLGAKGLHEVLEKMPPRHGQLLALGGIGADNAAGLRHPRLFGVAMIRGIWNADRPKEAVRALRNAWGGDRC